MKWSWRIGSLSGIAVYVHATFVLLLAWVGLDAYRSSQSASEAIGGVLFVLAVFGTVVLHELGHALAARRYGIRTRGITLLPIGGLAQLEGEPRTPKQELVIALAGPAVNFALAAALFVITSIVGMPSWGLLGSLMVANLSLGVFNLIPAFPMDGGRALRALVATRVGGPRATDIAVWIGKAAAIAFGIVGLITNIILTLVAVFVWFAASAEGKRSGDVYYGTRYGRDRTSHPWLHWRRDYRDDTSGTWGEPAHAYASHSDLLRHEEPRVVVIFGRRFL